MRVANEVLNAYQHHLSSLVLTPGSRGIFDVRVDGEILYSKHETGRHAKAGEIEKLLQIKIGPPYS